MASTESAYNGRRYRVWLAALFTLFVVVNFVVHLRAFWPCVIDDSYITARYAANFAEGAGLTFNVGRQPVEGFSDPLWLAYMALIYREFGASSVILGAKVISLASFAGIALLYLHSARETGASRAGVWVALGLCLSLPGMMLWSLSGLETMFYTLLILIVVVLTILEIRHRSLIPLAALTVGIATLVRPEAPMFFLAIAATKAYLWWHEDKPQLWRSLLCDSSILFVMLIAIVGFRYHYFHAFVPNTFFVKAGGVSKILSGAKYIVNYITDPLTAFFALAVIFGIVRHWRNPIVFASTVCIALQVAFIFWAGGDWMPLGRFFVPILPVALYPLALAFDDAREVLANPDAPRTLRPLAYTGLLLVVLGHTLFSMRAVHSLGWRLGHGLDTREALGVWMNHNLARDTWVAYGDVGALPYYSRLEWIDFNGLVTREVAAIKYADRTAPRTADAAIDSYIESQHPNLIILVAVHPGEQAQPFDYGRTIKDDPAFQSEYRSVGVLTAYLPAKTNDYKDGRYLQIYSRDRDNAVLTKEVACLNLALADGLDVHRMIDRCSTIG